MSHATQASSVPSPSSAVQILSANDNSNDSSIKLVVSVDDQDVTRQYHGVEDSDYCLPSDSGEQDRLEMQHHMMRHAFKSDVICPSAAHLLKTISAKALDVGCAQGWWLNSVAETFPLADLHGLDLSPDVIEKAKGTFPNLNFVQGNVLQGLPFASDSFNYVHQRLLIFGMPKDQFPLAIRELMRVTKSGGWIELFEVDATTYRRGPIAESIKNALHVLMEGRNFEFLAGTNLENYVHAATKSTNIHARNVSRKTVSLPLGWGGSLGALHGEDSKQFFLNMEDSLHKILGISRTEYRELLDGYIEECKTFETFIS